MAGGGGGDECILDLSNLEVDWLFLLYCMGGLILVSMILEYVMHRLESGLAHHEHYLRILRRVFKELVILGTLAFVLLMIRDFGRVSHQQFQLIEFAHIWIFLVGFVFVLQALLIMFMTRSVKDRWDRAFFAGTEKLLHEFNERRNSIHIYPAWVRYLIGKPIIMEQLELLVFREFFIRVCGLPKSFDFAKYLRRFLSLHIVEDVDVGWHSWALMIMLCGISVLVIHLTEEPLGGGLVNSYTVMYVALAITALNWFFAVVLILFLERGRDILLHKSGCSDLTVLPTTLALLHNPDQSEFAFVSSVEPDSPVSRRRQKRNRKRHVANMSSNHLRHPSSVSQTSAQDPGDQLLQGLTNFESFDTAARSSRPRSSIDHIKHRHKKLQINIDEILGHAFLFRTHLLDVYPFQKPFMLLFAFEFILLLQCFTVGLLMLELVQLASDTTAVILIVLALLLHLAMAIFMFPRVVRNWGLLEAICLIDKSSLEVVHDVLRVQEETHLVTRRFAITLYDAFLETLQEVIAEQGITPSEESKSPNHGTSPRTPNTIFKALKLAKKDVIDLGPAAIPETSELESERENNDDDVVITMDGVNESSSRIELVTRTISRLSVHMDEGIPLEDYAAQVLKYLDGDNNDARLSKFAFLDDKRGHDAVLKRTFAKLFSMLDASKTNVISPADLPVALMQHPFRFHVTAKQCRQMLRTLGCKNGFTLAQFIHIVHIAFRYLSVEDNGDDTVKMKDCFGEDAFIPCKNCNERVPIEDIQHHAHKCGKAPNYALTMVTQAVAYINDSNSATGVEILDPLPWTTRPRRMSTDSNMRSVRALLAAEELARTRERG